MQRYAFSFILDLSKNIFSRTTKQRGHPSIGAEAEFDRPITLRYGLDFDVYNVFSVGRLGFYPSCKIVQEYYVCHEPWLSMLKSQAY